MAITYRHSNKVRQVSSFLVETLIKKTSKFLDVSLKPSQLYNFGFSFLEFNFFILKSILVGYGKQFAFL